MKIGLAFMAMALTIPAWADLSDRAAERIDPYAGFGAHGGDVLVTFQNEADRNKVAETIRSNRKNGTDIDPLRGIDIQTLQVELLDLNFARSQGLDGKADELIEAKGTRREIVQERLERLKEKTSFSSLLKGYIEGSMSDGKWIPAENGVIEIDDSGHSVYFGQFKLLLQIAVQDQFQVFFDARLFNRMNSLNQAALMFHEVLYRHAAKLGHTDSRAVQIFVGKLFSKSFDKMSGAEINDLLIDLGLAGKTPIMGTIPLEVGGKTILFQETKVFDEQIKMWKLIDSVDFYDSRNVKAGVLWQETWIDGLLLKTISATPDRDKRTGFYESGKLYWGTLASDAKLGNIQLQANMSLRLYENGKLQMMMGNSKKIDAQGLTLPENSEVNFSEDGRISTIKMHSREMRIDGVSCRPGLHLTLHPSGHLKNCYIDFNQVVNGIMLKELYEAYFHENGQLKHGVLALDAKFKKRSGWLSTVTCPMDHSFELDPEGYIIKCGDKSY